MRLFAFICARRTEVYPIYAVLARDRCRFAAFIMLAATMLVTVIFMALALIVRAAARRINAGFIARHNTVAVIIFAHCCQSFLVIAEFLHAKCVLVSAITLYS